MVSLLEIGISNCCFAAVLAVVALAVTRFSRNHQLAFILWLFVLVKLVTPPLWTISIPFGNSQLAEYGAYPLVPLEGKAKSDADSSTINKYTIGRESNDDAAKEFATVATDIYQLPRRWNVALIVAWSCVLSSCVWASIICVRVRRFLQIIHAADHGSHELRLRADRLSRKIGLRRRFEIKTVEGSLPPMLWSLGRIPIVLLPKRFIEKLTAPQLDTVILHELAHVRRRDDWVVIFESLETSLFWWNPVVWFTRSRLRTEAEHCCDELVIQALPGSRQYYGQALLHAAEFQSRQQPLPVYANAFGRRHLLKERIEMILKCESGRAPRFARTFFYAIALAILPLAANATLQSDETAIATPAASEKDADSGKAAANENRSRSRGPRNFLLEVPPEKKDAPRPVVRQHEVWAMDADGRNPRKVASFGDFTIVNSPEVSPDGKFVAVDGWKVDQNLRDARVLVVNVQNGEVKDLVRGCMPTWSPDGNWIALCKYGDERGVYIRSLNGKVERLLDRDGWGIQWSPDGFESCL